MLSRSKKFDLPEREGDIEEYIDVLIEHQANCERQGKYVEAEMSKKRVTELKADLERHRREELKSRHINEKLEVERAHLEEFNKFNEFWDGKMAEFDDEARRIEAELV